MPSGPQLSRTYYDILGVNRTASNDEIKKRYRELARTSHPDVNPGDPKASEKFAEVTNAYKTLSDTLSRANYDAELSLLERRAETARARAGGFNTYATYATQAPRPSAPSSGNTNQTNNPPPNNGDEAVRLASQARKAMSQARYMEARDLAQRSLRARRTAEGYEVLGDVYRMQGRNEQAINMYTMSLQLNPRNGLLMERLQRLTRGNSSPRQERRYDARGDAPRSNPNPPPPPRDTSAPPYPTYSTAPRRPSSFGANLSPEKRPLLLMMAILFGYGTTFLLLMALMVFWHEAPQSVGPIPFALLSKWSGPLITVLIGCGVATGWAMSTTGAVRRLEDELIFSRPQSGFVPPIGPILLLLSAISFWAAALIHIILSLLQEVRIAGILRAFLVVTAITIAAALFYDETGRGQILLFGGNVVFLSFVFGWFIGDLFRND